MIKNELRELIKKTEKRIAVKHPEDSYGSRCSLWTDGLRDGDVSQELYDAAHEYYGSLWHYVGD